jgi:hypothetical protein
VTTLIVAAGAPSKVPFYIAGALLVIWALGLAAVGLTRPSFPYNERGARGVMAGSFLLMVVVMASAILTSSFGH